MGAVIRMKNKPIFVPYNLNLEALEKVLAEVKTPGNYFTQGIKATPIPRMEVNGVGTISFPIPKEQINKMIQKARLAPYGRGQETLLDVSVRKVWQISPQDVKISGSSWVECFDWILSKVKKELGCSDALIHAEFYKLLIYEKGCFFLTHRDTEKAPGMFATLVISLPCLHKGGELVIRHTGQEATIDMSRVDISEIAFAAFYADCEHEVKPVVEGYRVCLVYNLMQKIETKQKKPLTAPLYTQEIKEVASILQNHLLTKGQIKIAWLLEHQYSSAELSFPTLKNKDAALAKVLSQAASQSGCAIHLGIVHIIEEGSAEPEWGSYRHRRYRYEEEPEDFEILEVTNQAYYINGWVNLENQPTDLGELPIKEGEILPQGALENELPDEERLLESTGNEGASFERAYHRAALVIWHSTRYIEILLQSGYQAAIAYLKKQREAPISKKEIAFLTKKILDHWEAHPRPLPNRLGHSAERLEMLKILAYLEGLYLEDFIAHVILQEFDGSETESLVGLLHFLDPSKAQALLSKLISIKMPLVPNECIKLAVYLFETNLSLALPIAGSVIASLKDHKLDRDIKVRWYVAQVKPIDPLSLAKLWILLKENNSASLQRALASKIIELPAIFPPETKVIPILRELYRQYGALIKTEEPFIHLCHHAAQFFLNRSGHPPEPPKNWSQEVTLSCNCEDCQELQRFARDPEVQVHRFRVRKDRRNHIHNIIDIKKLDMTHETERTGSPQTLVCKKNRHSYELHLKQYQSDLTLLQEIASWLEPSSSNIRSQLEKAFIMGAGSIGK